MAERTEAECRSRYISCSRLMVIETLHPTVARALEQVLHQLF